MTSITARRWDTGEPVEIAIRGSRIARLMPALRTPPDVTLPFVGPGLLDLQVNGYRGLWFNSEHLTPQHVCEIVHELLRQGLTRCLPTLITAAPDAIVHGLSTIRRAVESDALIRAVVAGCHVEGPFISPADGPRGAHPVSQVRPASLTEVRLWQRAAGGLLRLVTLAPEVQGTDILIPALAGQGVTVAIGHTAATSHEIHRAVSLGASLGTHLGNGCAALVPRHDNPIWAQLADDRLSCSVIADGWHVPRDFLTCVIRCKSPARVILTSDVSGFAGLPAGRHSSGSVSADVLSDGRIVAAGQTQYLAGSSATLTHCISHIVSGSPITLSAAWDCASRIPARLLRLPAPDLCEGAAANFTVFRADVGTSPLGEASGITICPLFCAVNGTVIPSGRELSGR